MEALKENLKETQLYCPFAYIDGSWVRRRGRAPGLEGLDRAGTRRCADEVA